MTTNEIIKRLFLAYAKQDNEEFLKIADEFIDTEKQKKHNIAAKQLKEALYSPTKSNKTVHDSNRFRANIPIPRDNDSGFPLLEIREYNYSWEELVISPEKRAILENICKEIRLSDVLATYNLSPTRKALFCGLPGTGKTFTAKLLSSVMQIPLVYINFDAIISSYLGETATNLRKVFEFIKNGMWIVLFDEVDIIGKNRDDHHESGEIKRVVNNFLQMIDNFDGDSLIICATNHPHILDPAIWRRFDEIVTFELPSTEERLLLLRQFLKPIKKDSSIDWEIMSKETEGFSPSDIQLMCKEALKRVIVNNRDLLTSNEMNYVLSRFKERFILKQTSWRL
ncbi:AAA family ATPase [Paenibacillus piscarius]|uniref:AAA family ATPase n=1 Tax=Paenibacillus piscarius TaxID=1089681 RepID=UPI001EE85D10|nr:ATP-binding protein [Paenibacillus piscarius]